MVCTWFALCVRTAVGTLSHPIIGQVPICAECHAKNERLAGKELPLSPLPASE